MATVIDALILTLGLDPSDYIKKGKQVDDAGKKMSDNLISRTKAVESETKKASAVFSELRTDVLALMAVFLGGRGLEEFIKDISFADAQMARVAKTTNMSVQELSQWKGAADLAGGSGESLIGTLQGLSDQYNQWQLTGESSIAPALRALQTINPNLRLDKNGHMADLGQFLLQLSDTVKNMPAGRARSLLQMLGIDSDTINVILQGRAALSGYLDEVKKLQGPVEQSALAGKKLQTAYAEAKVSFEGAGRVLLVQIAPALIEVLHLLRDFGLWAQQHPKAIEAAFWAMTTAVLALSAALTVNLARLALSQVAGAFGLIIGVIRTLLLWMSVLTVDALPALSAAFYAMDTALAANPIGAIVLAVAALAGAAYLIYEYWGPIKGWWHDLWASMGVDVKKVNEILRNAAEMALLVLPGGSALAFQMMAEDAKGGDKGAAGGAPAATTQAPNLAAAIAAFGGAAQSGAAGSGLNETSAQSFLRENFPGVRITGGQRTAERNAQLTGSAKNSMHISGQAVDFVLPTGVSAASVKAALIAAGFPVTEFFNEGRHGEQGPHVHWGWGQKGGRHIAVPRGGARGPVASGGTTVHQDNRTGPITIHTAATDAAGTGRAVRRELQTHAMAAQANTGLA